MNLIFDVIIASFDKHNTDSWINIKYLYKLLNGSDDNSDFTQLNMLTRKLKSFFSEVNTDFSTILSASAQDLKVKIWKIINFFGLDTLKAFYPQYAQGSYINKLLEDLSEFIWKEFLVTKDIIQAIKKVKGEDSIPIMTIHKSKGLEYETVFFVGLEDDAFWSYSSQSGEDTCAFFVALSRAKRNLFFTFSEDRIKKGISETQTKVNIKPFYDMLNQSGIIKEVTIN